MNQDSELRAFLRSRWGLDAIAFLAIAALMLVFEHWAHIVGSDLLLGVLLIACIGMHLFMHGSHGGHGGHGGHRDGDE